MGRNGRVRAMGEVVNSLAILTASLLAALLLLVFNMSRDRWAASFTDKSSGLANRKSMNQAGTGGAQVVVARLDRFNAIAATLSPDLAIRLLIKVAERLAIANEERRIYRVDDVSLAWIEHDGEETVLEDRLEAIDRFMRSPVDCGRLIDISLSFGIAPIEAGHVEEAIANAASAATYAARKALRWHRFSGTDDPDSDWHLSLLSELDAAMTSGQLWNAYQPKIDLATGRIFGVEALVRWLHPVRGPIAPTSFIPLLEKYGRVRDVSLHVIARAIEDAAQWETAGTTMNIAVNVAPGLLGDSSFMEQVSKMLHNSAMPAERITIELTGSPTINDAEIVAMENWRSIGVALSVGDGDSSLALLEHLGKLPVSELKIDQAVIRGLDFDEARTMIVRSTINLAHGLGIKVVAEGIEDAACLKLLTDIGCDAGQGYYIGRPMSASNLRVFLGAAVQAA